MSVATSTYTADPKAQAISNDRQTLDMYGTEVSLVRGALGMDLKKSRFSRPEVAMRLGISVAMLNAYVAETAPHRFPAELIPAWVRVLESRRMLDVLCEASGLSVATKEDMDFAELGRTQLRAEKLKATLWEKF